MTNQTFETKYANEIAEVKKMLEFGACKKLWIPSYLLDEIITYVKNGG